MTKVISFWGDQNIFDPNVINHIRQVVTGQLPLDSHYQSPQPIQQQHQKQQQQQQQQQQNQNQQQPPRMPVNPPQPPRNYYELPAGLMLLAQVN
jgi:hemolysin activation/secretion protein